MWWVAGDTDQRLGSMAHTNADVREDTSESQARSLTTPPASGEPLGYDLPIYEHHLARLSARGRHKDFVIDYEPVQDHPSVPSTEGSGEAHELGFFARLLELISRD